MYEIRPAIVGVIFRRQIGAAPASILRGGAFIAWILPGFIERGRSRYIGKCTDIGRRGLDGAG